MQFMNNDNLNSDPPSVREANAMLEAEARLADIVQRCERVLDLADPMHIHTILELVREVRDIARGEDNG